MGAGGGEKIHGYLKTTHERKAMQEGRKKERKERRKRKEKRKEGQKDGRKEGKKERKLQAVSQCTNVGRQVKKEEGPGKNRSSYIPMLSGHTTHLGSWYEANVEGGRRSHGRLRSWKGLVRPVEGGMKKGVGA